MHVAVTRHIYYRGIEAPGYGGHTYDWRHKPGSTENSRGIVAPYSVLATEDALRMRYDTHAHMVGYILLDNDKNQLKVQPRVNKGGAEWLRSQGYSIEVQTLIIDIDNPGHQLWSVDLLEEWQDQVRKHEFLRTVGIYFTRRGWRTVQPLSRGIDTDTAEAILQQQVNLYHKHGISADTACVDWTRQFALAKVIYRDGHVQHREPMLEHMTAIEPPAAKSRVKRTRSTIAAESIVFADAVPVSLRGWLSPIAMAIKSVTSEWHTLGLALSGALLQRGAHPSILPALVTAIFAETGADTRLEDRATAARTTVAKKLARSSYTGMRELQAHWPEVANVLNSLSNDLREIRGWSPNVPERLTREEAQRRIAEHLARPGDGVSIVQVECGAGKTHAAILAAAKRAQVARTGIRAPLGSKTTIVSRTRALAVQTRRALINHGVEVYRRYGPLAETDDDGNPVCRIHAPARELASGGIPLQWTVCKGRNRSPCQHLKTCAAASGEEGSPDALVTVGTVGLLGELAETPGKTGLLILDEPPDQLETVTITAQQFATALRAEAEKEADRDRKRSAPTASKQLTAADYFTARYYSAMAPAMLALKAWLDNHEPEKQSSVLDAIRLMSDAITPQSLLAALKATKAPQHSDPALTAIECARAAHDKDATDLSPSIRIGHLVRARLVREAAAELASVSAAFDHVYRALTAPGKTMLRIEERPGGKVLQMTWARSDMTRALKRDGATVLLDASADVFVNAIEKVVGYKPRIVRVAVKDGAPIQRYIIRTRDATRTGWFVNGIPQARLIAPALRNALRYAYQSRPRSVGLITWKMIELLLSAAWHGMTDKHRAEWPYDQRLLSESVEVLKPVVNPYPPALLGHYQATRGLNDWQDCDVLVTLGDPYPALADVQVQADYLGLDADEQLLRLCRAELEQAHGRIRAPWRSVPAVVYHVGNVLPGGSGWYDATVITPTAGGRHYEPAMTCQELRAIVAKFLDRRDASERLGINMRVLKSYLIGERAIPPTVAGHILSVMKGIGK